MLKKFLLIAAVSVGLTAGASTAREGPPPDPTEEAGLITAGFLTHHPDLKYRMLGMTAYGEHRFDDALRLFRRASFYGDKPSQGMVAEMYWNGDGVSKDPSLAYAWMDLAAERGYEGFLGLRERYWEALDEAQRAEALEQGQAVYARFGDAAAKPRYKLQLRIAKSSTTGSRTGFAGNLKIIVPGPGDGTIIDGSKFHDERYWNAEKYWDWQDGIWMKPRIGRVEVGELEVADDAASESRIPETVPEVDAPKPDVPDEPVP